MQFTWPDGKKMALSLCFDDGRPSQLTTGIPVLDRHQVRGTFYALPAAVEERAADWRAAARRGHEIGNHTETHPCSGNYRFARCNPLEEYTLDRIESEIVNARTRIEKATGVRTVTFAYPCGQKFVGRGEKVQSYVPLVARHFLAARSFYEEGPNDPLFCDLSQLYSMGMNRLTWEQLQPQLTAALHSGGWLILTGHDVGQTNYQSTLTETLDSICAFAADPDNGIWIDTVSEIAGWVESVISNQ